MILQSGKILFELVCYTAGSGPGKCEWAQMRHELDVSVSNGVMSYLPGGYTPICQVDSPGILETEKQTEQE